MAIHVVRQRNKKEFSTNMRFASEFLNTGSSCLKIWNSPVMMKGGLKLSVAHIMEEFSKARHQYARVFVCFARMKIHLFLN